MKAPFEGGCLCGAVRYTCAAEPVVAGHCHCEDCRRSSGSGHCSHLGVPGDAVKLTGETRGFGKAADSGNTVTRYFCPTCGSPVYSTNSGMQGMMFLRASSLDDPEVFQPAVVVYTSRRPSWDVVGQDLPQFETMPPRPPA